MGGDKIKTFPNSKNSLGVMGLTKYSVHRFHAGLTFFGESEVFGEMDGDPSPSAKLATSPRC